ncbi:MAG: hypothetical protein IJF65_03795 [Clostridia bacterium]|nr:hypothetical protein [Clostridia bacterium]
MKKYGVFEKENLDERQLLIRGDAYKYGFLTLVTLLIINAFAIGVMEMALFDGMWGYVFMILVGTIVACLYMLRHAYYDFDQPGDRRMWYVFTVCGLMSGALSVIEMVQGRFEWQSAALISEDIFHLLSACGWTLLGLYGVYKTRRYLKANPPD